MLVTINEIPPIYEQDFETSGHGWTATGPGIVRSTRISTMIQASFISPGPRLTVHRQEFLTPTGGNWCFWYGDPNTGNFGGSSLGGGVKSGGSSTTNTGTLTSPPIVLLSPAHSALLKLMAGSEIESCEPER